MASADIRTLLPLDTFASIAGIHPLHFNQVQLSGLPDQMDDSTARTCDVPIFKYQWQTANRIGREDIAQAIFQAEQKITDTLGFKPAPSWTREDRVSTPRPGNVNLINLSARDVRGFGAAVRASEGYIISGGVEAKSLISAGAAVVYTDEDGDNYAETATITVNTTVTVADEIAVYYPGESGSDAWEIRPLRNVVISGGVAIITCYRHQLVNPNLVNTMFPRGVDGTNDANFLSTVDVYRHYNDPQTQVQLIYDDPSCAVCSGNGCVACGYGVQSGCLVVRDTRLGMVSFHPGTWNGDGFDVNTFSDCRSPDRLNLYYYAGWRNTRAARPLVEIDNAWAQAITYYALSFLSRPICACQPVEAAIAHWREDLGHVISARGESSSFRLSMRELDNPFGTTRGALYAWRMVQDHRLGKAAINA